MLQQAPRAGTPTKKHMPYGLIYRMDLNFCSTKLSRIENFAFFAFLFSRMRVPQYTVKYIDYISVLICASYISHITKHVWAARRVGVAIAKQ